MNIHEHTLQELTTGVRCREEPTVSGVEVRGTRLVVTGPAAFAPEIKDIVSRRWIASAGAWTFPATPTAAFDLWQAAPPSETVVWTAEARELQAKALADRESLYRGRRLFRGDTKTYGPPPDLPGRYLHQRAGISAFEAATAGLLHWGMGTGKTLWTLDLIRRSYKRFVLVVCKRSCILDVWKREIDAHQALAGYTPLYLTSDRSPSPRVVSGSTGRKAAALEDLPAWSVVVVNYESIWREPLASAIEKIPWGLLICDEIQAAKSHDSRISTFLADLALKVPRRFGLSGTPTPQEPVTDAFGVMRILDPGVFGENFYEHRGRYAVVGEIQLKRRTKAGREIKVRVEKILQYKNRDEFAKRFNSITFRVDSDDVLDLPKATHVKRHFTLPQKAQRVYDEIKAKSGAVQNKLLALMQVACGTKYLEHDGRVKALADVLGEIGEEPVVVFCRFRRDIDKCLDLCERLQIPAFEFSGRNVNHRQRLLEMWRETKGGVLVAQIEAAAEGISLTHARYVVYYSQTWRLGIYEQSLKRSRRPGQKRPVFYIHLLAEDTVDDLLLLAHEKRRDVIEWITRDPSLLERSATS